MIGSTKYVNRFVESGDPKIMEQISKMQSDPNKPRSLDMLPHEQSEADQARDNAILKWLIEQNRRKKDDPDDNPDDEPEPVM